MKIEEGYKAYNGHVFTAREADTYNRACEHTELMRKLRGDGSKAHDNALNSQHITFIRIIGE